MKTGLRKRETYDELINELERDPIKHYPNRKASQIENSNYMSQLSGDFDEMQQQHERVKKEQQKANLLQQMAASSGLVFTKLEHLRVVILLLLKVVLCLPGEMA